MKTQAKQSEFIRLNVQSLSELALEGFQRRGYGAICVNVDKYNKVLDTAPHGFMPASMIAEIIDGWKTSKEREMILGYSPGREFVVLFQYEVGECLKVECYHCSILSAPVFPAVNRN